MTSGERPDQGRPEDELATDPLPPVDADTVPDMPRYGTGQDQEDTALLPVVPRLEPLMGAGLLRFILRVEPWHTDPNQPAGAHEQTQPILAHSPPKGFEQEQIATHVDQIRAAMAALNDRERELLEPYMDRLAAEYVFDRPHAYWPPSARGRSLIDWIATDAEDPYVAEFIQAHANVLDGQRQHPEVGQAMAEEKDRYIRGIRPLVEQGYFDPHALTAIPRLRSTEVRYGDVWDTLLRGYLAYQKPGTRFMVLAQSIAPSADRDVGQLVGEIRQTVMHEMDHVEFSTLPYIFMEAMAQHGVLSMRHGEPDVIEPVRRQDGDRTYEAFRALVHVVSTEGDFQIPAARWMRAHTSAGSDSESYRELEDDVERACGVSLDELNRYCLSVAAVLRLQPEYADWPFVNLLQPAARMTIDRLRVFLIERDIWRRLPGADQP